MRVCGGTLVTGHSNPPSNRPDFSKARVVNLEEVLGKRQADARLKAKAERQKPDFVKPRSKHPFIRRVPHVWLLVLDEAEAMPALPLLLAIGNQMNLRRRKSSPHHRESLESGERRHESKAEADAGRPQARPESCVPGISKLLRAEISGEPRAVVERGISLSGQPGRRR
jgi:hypothetical protein